MEDEIAYPGLVGAGVKPAQRSPYDRSFEPGEATTADVRRGLVEMLLSGLGLVKGGVLTSQGASQSAGGLPPSRRVLPPSRTGYPTQLDVRVRFPESAEMERLRAELGVPNTPLYDVMAGLNRGHAAWRARQNWEGEDVLPLPRLRIRGR